VLSCEEADKPMTIRDGSEGQQPVGEGIEELESRNEVMPPKSTDPASAVSGSARPRPILLSHF
jgi:hypothetical protein